MLIEIVLNVARPVVGSVLTVAVPLNDPFPGFVPMPMVTGIVKPVTTAPVASSTATVKLDNAVPDVPFAGAVLNANWEGVIVAVVVRG